MKKSLSLLFVVAAFTSSAFAADSKTVTHTGNGTVEATTDTSHNPLTGNTTTTTETEAKNDAGKTMSKHKVKVKRGKHGEKMSKQTTNEKMDSEGSTTDKKTTEETNK